MKTGDFVSSLLTEKQKAQLDQPGFSQVFVIEGGRLTIIIAGNEREDTAHVAENNRRYIFELL